MNLDIPILLSESFFEYYTEYTDKQDFVGQLDFVMCQDAGEVINEKGLPCHWQKKNMFRLQEAAPVRKICPEVESLPIKIGSGPRKGHSKPGKINVTQKRIRTFVFASIKT